MCSIVKYKDLYINAFDIHQTNNLIDYLELLVDEKRVDMGIAFHLHHLSAALSSKCALVYRVYFLCMASY